MQKSTRVLTHTPLGCRVGARSRCRRAALAYVAGMLALSGAAVYVPAQAQTVNPALLGEIEELADKAADVRQVFRKVDTLSEAMEKSVTFQSCNFVDGGLKGKVELSFDVDPKIEVGGGVSVPGTGKNAKVTFNPLKISIAGSAASKASILSNFCLNYDALGGDWADIGSSVDIDQHEDDYLYYGQEDNEPDEPETSGRMAIAPVEYDGTPAHAQFLDAAPVEVLNALVDGLVNMGLDPTSPEQVATIIYGGGAIGTAQSIVDGLGEPLDAVVGSAGMIQDVVEGFPGFAQAFSAPVTALASIGSIEDPCTDLPIPLPDAVCDLGARAVELAGTMEDFAGDGLQAVTDLSGHIGTIESSIDRLVAASQRISGALEDVLYWVSTFDQRVDKITGNMDLTMSRIESAEYPIRNLANTLDLGLHRSTLLDNWGVCDTIESTKAFSPPGGIYCHASLLLNACALPAELQTKLECSSDVHWLTDLAGDAIEVLVDMYEEGVRSAEERWGNLWGATGDFFDNIGDEVSSWF